MVYRTARCHLVLSREAVGRCFGLLRSAGDVRACALDLNRHRRERGDRPVVSYQGLCAELTKAGPGTFGELSVGGARSVLRDYSDAWFSAGKRIRDGDPAARYPRRKKALVPVRWSGDDFALDGRKVTLQAARGAPGLAVRLDRDLPYPPGSVRSVRLGYADGRLYLDVTAEVPVAVYPDGQAPEPARAAGVDIGVIHPFAVAGPGGQALLVSGRAMRAESRQHLRDVRGRSRAAARRAPKPGQKGSRRWRQHRRAEKKAEARHKRRLAQARHEAARTVVTWAVQQKAGTLVIGDPAGVLQVNAGPVHNHRVHEWRPAQLIRAVRDKAEVAGIRVEVVSERGTSSTCPACRKRVPKPRGRRFRCPFCGLAGHRDLIGAVNIAARNPGGGSPVPVPAVAGTTHRRAGTHLPGAGPSRRDPRRRPSSRTAHRGHLAGSGPPPPSPPPHSGGAKGVARGNREEQHQAPGNPKELVSGCTRSMT